MHLHLLQRARDQIRHGTLTYGYLPFVIHDENLHEISIPPVPPVLLAMLTAVFT